MLSADKILLGTRKCFFYDFLQHDALVCVSSGKSVALTEEVAKYLSDSTVLIDLSQIGVCVII